MMTDKQQIEEIQQILIECCHYVGENGNILGNKCYKCEHWDDTNNVCCSYESKQATALYNAGCRKIAAGLKIVCENEYDKFMGKRESYNRVLELQANEIERLCQRLDQIKLVLEHQLTQADVIEAKTRKETAKDFIFKVESYLGYNADNETFTKRELLLILAEVAKEQYGVEVEDNGN